MIFQITPLPINGITRNLVGYCWYFVNNEDTVVSVIITHSLYVYISFVDSCYPENFSLIKITSKTS